MAKGFIVRRGGGAVAAIQAIAGDGIPVVYFSKLDGYGYYNGVHGTAMKEVAASSVTTLVTGSVRITFLLRRGSTSSTVFAQVYKNGSPVGTLRSTTTTAGAAFSEDFTFVKGDIFSLYGRVSINNLPVNIGFLLYQFTDIGFLAGQFVDFKTHFDNY